MDCRSTSSHLFTQDPIAQVAAFLRGQRAVSTTTAATSTTTTTPTSSTTRESRKDKHPHSTLWPVRFYDLQRILTGVISLPALPPFPYDMSFRGKPLLPGTPRVISPSPTPSSDRAEVAQDSYLGPMTRSAAKKRRSTPQPGNSNNNNNREPDDDALEAPAFRRSRTRSRSPVDRRKTGKVTGGKSKSSKSKAANADATAAAATTIPNGKQQNGGVVSPTPKNGHLAPPPAASVGRQFFGWRDFSRSPSPLGLIPIHRHWRNFIHKHEVPRKALHVSIGFVVIWLYLAGVQTDAVSPFLLAALVPIAAVDALRHRWARFNRFYVKVLGALMRESEYAGYNGVIYYLLGAWVALALFPKDVAVMGTLLLSWCDTAASTFGRLWGRYTPRIRRGKSVAGSLAAFLVGVGTAAWFWGWLVPVKGPMPGDEAFMFAGSLRLPTIVGEAIGLTEDQAVMRGPWALGIVSIWSGLVAAGSEMVNLFGLDDNLTIPVLSSLGIWGFLKIFG